MSYLEQSTRYIGYDARLGGRYRYHRPPSVLQSPLGSRYVSDLDRLFDAYGQLLAMTQDWARERYPKESGDSDFVYRQSIRAKALDAVRGVLPAASLSNVGIYGSGQGYEALLLRMRASPLPEARTCADLMLVELRKVIPSFLKRVDLPDRGGQWSDYLRTNREAMAEMATRLFPDRAAFGVGISFLLIAAGQAIASPLAGAGVGPLGLSGVFIACAGATGIGALLAPRGR